MIRTINIIYKDFPTCRTAAMVRENPDGSYTALLNSRMTRERQTEAMRHELEHISMGDLDSEECADLIEKLRHNEGGNKE